MTISLNRTKAILQKHKLRPQKARGQNFLIDDNILQKTIAAAGITACDGVIEIGPGLGALTARLLSQAKRVLAYEIDERFIDVLKQELPQQERLLLLHEDFLKADLDFAKDYFQDCAKVYVISNIPYYITTPIISKLLKSSFRFEKILLMMQKEVGLRLVARSGTKDYNAFSVFVQTKSLVRLVFDVSAHCFIPKPEVDSVLVEIIPKNEEPKENEAQFFTFVQNIFANRRKTLLNNLLRTYPSTRNQLEELFRELHININIRSENLDLKQIHDLFQKMNIS